MARNDGRIEPGQKLAGAISARAWNRAQDAADRVLGVGTGATGDTSGAPVIGRTVVLALNTGASVALGGILGINAPVYGSLANATLEGTGQESDRLRSMVSSQVFVGGLPSASGAIAIAVEPIASGKIGRVAIGGSVYFRLRVRNLLHRFASPIAGNMTQLQSSGCGPVQIIWRDGQVLEENKIAFGLLR